MDNQRISADFARPGGVSYAHASVSGEATSAAKTTVTPQSSEASRGLGGPVYVSPKGTVDAKSGVYVLQLRNSDTGEVKNQYPSKKVVEAYKRAPVVEQAPASEVAAPSASAPAAAPAAPATPATPAASTSTGVAVSGIGHNSDTLA